MALADDVTNRVPSATLVALTRPNSNTAATVDTTYLGYAVTDVEAVFAMYAGETYSSSSALHVALGVEGVLLKLKAWAGSGSYPKAQEQYEAWEKKCERAAKVLGRDRFAMKSSSQVTESDENPTDEEVRPALDQEIFDDLLPEQP